MAICKHNDFEIYYEYINPGRETIVLLSGIALASQAWKVNTLFQGLRRESYSLLILDNRGSGYSSSPRESWTVEDMMQDTLCVVNHLNIDQFHLYGVSMGGMIAQQIAIHHPDRLLSLTLANTAPSVEYIYTRAKEILSKHRLGDYIDDWMQFMKLIFTPDEYSEYEQTLRKMYRDRLHGNYPIQSKEGYQGQLLAVMTMDNTLKKLKGCSVPALLIYGRFDQIMKNEGMKALGEVLINSELKGYDTGHIPLPPRVSDYLVFLKSIQKN